MTLQERAVKPFVPGTTGWRADDLDNPEIEKLWMRGRYEIVEGVLTTMPAAYFEGGTALQSLIDLMKSHFRENGPQGRFATEVDLVLSPSRVAIVDAAFLTSADMDKQRKARMRKTQSDLKYGRLLIAPTLLIESVSLGHESHDLELKRNWYANRRVPNYWILNAYAKSLECLILQGSEYHSDQLGRGDDILHPSAFAGLELPLSKIWV